ncbi:MAG: BLUF domain-containing protein [Rubrivivax sp.]
MTESLVAPIVGCRYFYVSRLAPGQPVTVIAELLRVSRAFNRQHGITGALLFDGEHFAQLLEGDPAVVFPLAARIEADPRHAEVDVRLRIEGAFPRLFEQWVCGWAEQEEVGDRLVAAEAPALAQLTAFRELVEDSDVG